MQKKIGKRSSTHNALTIGIDLGDRWGLYCVLDEDREITEEGRVRMTRTALSAHFSGPHARIAVETGSQSAWVNEHLCSLGHEVIVANARELRAIPGSNSTYDFFEQCQHRMACAKCDFYMPKESTTALLLEGKTHLLRLLQEIPLGEAEQAAVEDVCRCLRNSPIEANGCADAGRSNAASDWNWPGADHCFKINISHETLDRAQSSRITPFSRCDLRSEPFRTCIITPACYQGKGCLHPHRPDFKPAAILKGRDRIEPSRIF